MNKKTLKIWMDVLHRNRMALILYGVFTAVTLAVSFVYDVTIEPVLYAMALALFFLIIFLLVDGFTEKRRSRERERAKTAILTEPFHLPEAETLCEADYREMIFALGQRLSELTAEYDAGRRDALDYYTGWVHQIKTPIAVMRLKLSDNTAENKALRGELFRIEQYAEMALNFIRLGEGASDLRVESYPLDDLICEAVRKFAPQFIEKKLTLCYEGTDRYIITDRKWFVFILEQLLSNAVKYTRAGSVTVKAEHNELIVSDTGCGITAEDLPRIFEKGYTGLNGRAGEQSSGLGLYLVNKAAKLINTPVRAESTVGAGTAFHITLSVGVTHRYD